MHSPSPSEPAIIRGLIITSARAVSLNSFSMYPPSDEYVQVRTELCGLCTWEQRVYRGAKQTYPFWGGHEVCGIVEKVGGQNFRGLKKGERVSLALMRRCGECHYCRRGLDNHCAYVRHETVESVPQGPRGLSDIMIVPSYQVFRLSPYVPPATGALVEPTACVLRSIDKAKVAKGNTVIVIGSGTMGLMHTRLLKLLGCKVVVCGDSSDHSGASAAGADVLLNLTTNNIEGEVLDITGEHGADAVFCTRNGTAGIDLAQKIVGRGGRVVLYQSIRSSDISTIKANDLHYREIEIVGTISQTIDDFRKAVELVTEHIGLWDFMATEVISADKGMLAFEKAMEPDINRILITFN